MFAHAQPPEGGRGRNHLQWREGRDIVTIWVKKLSGVPKEGGVVEFRTGFKKTPANCYLDFVFSAVKDTGLIDPLLCDPSQNG